MINNKNSKALAYVIFCIAAIQYLVNAWISFQYPVWMDEAVTIKYYLNYDNPFQIIKDLFEGVDVYPPLYYFLGSILCKFSINDEFILSLFTKLLLVSSVFMLLLELKKKMKLITLAIIALILSSTSDFMFLKNFEIRAYGLFFFFITITFINYIRFKERKKIKYLIYFIISNTLMLYTHYYAAFLLLSLFLVEAINYFRNEKDYKILLGLIISVVLFSPWVPAIINQYQNIDGYFYQEIPDFYDFFKLPFSFIGIFKGALITGLILIFIILRLRKKTLIRELIKTYNNYFNFIAATIILVILGFILSQFKLSVYYPRYFISIVLSIIIVTAIIIENISKVKRVIMVIALLAFIASTLETVYFHKLKKDFWYWIDYYESYESSGVPFVCEESRHYFILDYYSKKQDYYLVLDKTHFDEMANNSNDYFAYYWSKGMMEKYDIPTIQYYEDFIEQNDSFYFLSFEEESYFNQFYFNDTSKFECNLLHRNMSFIKRKK